MINLEEAWARIDSVIQKVDWETVPLPVAGGRILREEVIAAEDLPPFDRSSMDGYAISSADPSSEFRVVEELPAGAISTRKLGIGQCARIFTGAALPPGADAVIMQELATVRDGMVRFSHRPADSAVRRRGEDARAGQVLLRPGLSMRGVEIGVLAMLGVECLQVSRRLRVAHLVSGDELAPADQSPLPGQIRDANGPMLSDLLRNPAVEYGGAERCPDDYAAAQEKARRLVDGGCDLLLISGGASVGDHDHAAQVLESLGFTVHFRQINLRPGKPLIFASRAGQAAFAIPGNPVSHLVCFELVIRRAVAAMIGQTFRPQWNVGHLSTDFPYQAHPRETFWPARWRMADGQIWLDPLPWQSSGHLCALVDADALIRLPSGTADYPAGASVNFWML